MIKKHWKLLLLVIVVLVAGGIYYNYRTKTTTTAQNTINPKMVMEVKKSNLRKTISSEGYIEPIDEEDLSFPSKSTGSVKVKKIYVKEGDRVEKGQLLMELDETEARLDYLQKQNDYKRAKINGSKNDIEEAELNLKLAKDNLDNLDLVAPFSGIITDIDLEEGNYYTSGTAATIKDISRLRVEVSIDESDIPSVKLGQKVILTLPSLPGVELTGKVSELEDEADNGSSVVTLPIKVLLDKTDRNIKLGVSASLDIIVGEVSDKIVVPITAVVDNNGKGSVVKVVNGKPEKVSVQTGLSNGLNITIDSGLQVGDKILVNSYQQAPGYGTGSNSNRPFMGGGPR